ncbi:MAG: DUF1924 domain-containing protein [Burkholderiales bacterium]
MRNLSGKAAVLVAALVVAAAAAADTPASIADGYAAAAKREVPGFSGFSAQRGAQFFRSTHGNDWSCASCHTADPAKPGRHARTGVDLQPLAPAAKADRFTDLAKVEKWFRRNCNDVVGRECTVQEKGDVLAFLMQAGR